MATLDRPSLRGEFERLKAEFERLSAAGKMPAETRTLFNALLMLFEVPMAIFLEKTTSKGKPQFEHPTLANGPGRQRRDPARRPGQGRESKRCAVAPQPNRDNHRGGGGRCLRRLRRRSRRYPIAVQATAHADRHPVREGRPSPRRASQGLPPVSSSSHFGMLLGFRDWFRSCRWCCGLGREVAPGVRVAVARVRRWRAG